MLSEPDIQRAASQLAKFRDSNTLHEILSCYAGLIEDYRRLRSDHEECDACENYKQIARSQERNPFVLVLVDGDAYVFQESLLKGVDGGRHAAQLLTETVKASLRAKGLEHCQVMVRVYANVAGLSKTLCKAGLLGAEKRSLAPFIASFNHCYGLVEFIDAGKQKENAELKLRALMSLYGENSHCKHIYFAACHDVGYLSDLIPHIGNHRRFTLVDSPGVKFHDEFTKLGLGVEELPGVFRTNDLDHYQPPLSDSLLLSRASAGLGALTSSPSSLADPAGRDGVRSVCRFHNMGRCKYGKKCKNIHVEDGASSKASWQSMTNDPQLAAGGGGGALAESRYRTAPLFSIHSDAATDFMSGHDTQGTWTQALLSVHDLPRKEEIPAGQVAVNKNGFRLDPYLAPSSPETLSRLKARVGRQRVCNSFHLNGACESGESCVYDHGPLDDECRGALESLARTMPCGKRGACRNAACTCGHVCQNLDCRQRGGKAHCKLPAQSHGEAMAVARYFPATNGTPTHRQSCAASAAGSIFGENDDMLVMSPTLSVRDVTDDALSSGRSKGGLLDGDSSDESASAT